ncbi:Hypothetical protein EHI5A_063800 [Entamoeba histolytica KU27]|uniref:TLDc domain-containing protein n=1 Tax=Entamoeba histolytica KU27 TaxID=885311 RepID=M2RWA7_ENTHI|nr:Hypothetical protein EHI5A_063800 [Entamoeba histolytica KU27]
MEDITTKMKRQLLLKEIELEKSKIERLKKEIELQKLLNETKKMDMREELFQTFIQKKSNIENELTKKQEEGKEYIKQRNMNVEDIINTLQTEMNDTQTKNILSATIGYEFSDELIKIFQEKVHLKHTQLLFSSNTDDLTSYSFNNKIMNKSNVMIFIKTENNSLIGSFTSTTIPPPSQNDRVIVTDQSHFIFIVTQNGLNTFSLKKNWMCSLCICPNTSDDVVVINSFFLIKKSRELWIPSEPFKENYSSTLDLVTLLNTNVDGYSTIKSLTAIEWF